MRTEQEIRNRVEELESEFDSTSFLTKEHTELIRGGKLQGLKWVLNDD